MQGLRIDITGIVQGVGFRPFVYNLARKYGLAGYCLNDSEGVVIEVQGDGAERFAEELKSFPPPLSMIKGFAVKSVSGEPFTGFEIRESISAAGKFSLVSPDIAICADCLQELLDPSDRRYLYPFINCTNCGPRYSIVLDIPYDRCKTTMSGFKMCPDCEREYKDPADRRFHAQPNACPACGPKVWLHGGGRISPTEEAGYLEDTSIQAPRRNTRNEIPNVDSRTNFGAVIEAQRLLREGKILAIKGLGGFHLACDAKNDEAVSRLRERKRRSLQKGPEGSNKPFALMAPDIETVREIAEVSGLEADVLAGRERPIVLLEKRLPNGLSGAVSPNNDSYGVMLPYTPLHYLLFRDSGFTALVMTSGNLSEEPIVVSNEEALKKLSVMADAFLLHDRDIYMRVDDSIARVSGGKKTIIRRARGFTPKAVELDTDLPDILACGGELKNTLCLTKGRNAILSQHMGDLENLDAMEFYLETLKNLKNTFRSEPVIVAHDMHPDYLSTRFALEYAQDNAIPEDRVVAVQHHHAHIVSCMAENGLREKVIGIAFDGTGYGTDGTIWGGEFLTADRGAFTREAHLEAVAMPGGEKAIAEPWRMALSYLLHSLGDDRRPRAFYERFDPWELETVRKMIRGRLNSPMASSMGRLFDAVASIIGLRDRSTFEAEAAMELEAIARHGEEARPYPFAIVSGAPSVIDLRPTIRAIVKDLGESAPASIISGRFHATIAEASLTAACMIREKTGVNEVVLSGGVFQNRLLSSIMAERLSAGGFRVYTHSIVPANDGGISLGQAVAAWERVRMNVYRKD